MEKTLAYKKTRWVISFEGVVVEVKVKKGDKVKVGEVLAIVEEKEYTTIDMAPYVNHWSEINKGALRNDLMGKNITPGMFLVKGLIANIEGMCESVDEFMVARVKLLSVHQRSVVAPVDGLVGEINKESMELVFRALEVPIVGINSGKTWGESQIKLVENINEINFRMRGMIIFVANFDRALLTKAEVVGLAGVIIVGEEGGINAGSKSLILGVISSAIYQQMVSKLGNKDSFRMLLNTKLGRLLVAVQ